MKCFFCSFDSSLVISICVNVYSNEIKLHFGFTSKKQSLGLLVPRFVAKTTHKKKWWMKEKKRKERKKKRDKKKKTKYIKKCDRLLISI